MNISDADFSKAIKDLDSSIFCWTMPSYNIKLSILDESEYKITLSKDGKQVFENDKGIEFRIHYDSVQRVVGLYFFNGTRGWFLHTNDLWNVSEINNTIAGLISIRFDMMNSVFEKANNNEDSLEEYYKLNVRHYYTIVPDANNQFLRHLYLAPKKTFDDNTDFSKLNQSDYKFLEGLFCEFKNYHRAVFDTQNVGQSKIEQELKKHSINKDNNFESFVNNLHTLELENENQNKKDGAQ